MGGHPNVKGSARHTRVQLRRRIMIMGDNSGGGKHGATSSPIGTLAERVGKAANGVAKPTHKVIVPFF
jgi:hypothetical protein